MKYIFLNLKRFDILPEFGGVNSLAKPAEWGAFITSSLEAGLKKQNRSTSEAIFPIFFPEAHILGAAASLKDADKSLVKIGSQSVHFDDTQKGGNFGAFTSYRTAHAARTLGCSWTIIGHSEERRFKTQMLTMAGVEKEKATEVVHQLLAKEVQLAHNAGLNVLYCIGETAEEVDFRTEVLKKQIEQGLGTVAASGKTQTVLAYEPIWAIGPGKTPPSAEQITQIAQKIKQIAPAYPLVYGGGLKKENAESIGAIKELDGGLIALTRFAGDIGFYPEEYLEIVDLYF